MEYLPDHILGDKTTQNFKRSKSYTKDLLTTMELNKTLITMENLQIYRSEIKHF